MDIFLILALRPKSCNMSHITGEQRYTIEALLTNGKTQSFIAAVIKKINLLYPEKLAEIKINETASIKQI